MKRTFQRISSNQKIVILTHYNPDGDAIGSSLGLQHFLAAKGISSEIVVPNDFPKFLKWMPEAKKITIADYKRKKAWELINEADVLFVLDFNASHRAGNLVAKRVLLEFGFKEKIVKEEQVIIEKSPRKYSDQYLEITKDFHVFG
jgi:bifunctional oligoribonuclease and PAP phosphatase NrnA